MMTTTAAAGSLWNILECLQKATTSIHHPHHQSHTNMEYWANYAKKCPRSPDNPTRLEGAAVLFDQGAGLQGWSLLAVVMWVDI